MRKLVTTGVVVALGLGVAAAPAAAQPVSCEGRRATIVGRPGVDTLEGTPRDDVIHGLGGHDTIAGGGGDDLICTGGDGATVAGGPGNDRIVGSPSYDAVAGGAGDDVVTAGGERDGVAGGRGNDRLDGGPGIDLLGGEAGDDRLSGAAGDDVLDGGTGLDVLDGGDGSDTVTFGSAETGVTVDLARGRAAGDTVKAVENATGTRRSDSLRGSRARNVLLGGEGADRVDGGGGGDVVLGSAGDDVLAGGPGRDVVSFATSRAVVVDLARGRASGDGRDRLAGFESVHGSPRADVLFGDDGRNTFLPLGPDNLVDGRGGADLVSYRGEDDDVEVRLTRDVVRVGDAFEDEIKRIEGAVGGDRYNVFVGDAGDNVFLGGTSNNTYLDSGGNDLFRGSSNTTDHLDLSGTPVPAKVDLARGVADALGHHRLVGIEEVTGTPFEDVIGGAHTFDRIRAGDGADVVEGGGGPDQLSGDAGDDVLRGGGNDDDLTGSLGDDRLDGGDGIDLLYDGEGDDEVRGGAGTDLAFVGSGSDRVDGGAGIDVVHPDVHPGITPEPFELDLAAGTAGGYGADLVANFEGAVGTAAADVLTGDALPNLLYGGQSGGDVLAGGAGDDLLQTLVSDDDVSGGEGDDYLMTALGNDRADGGPGTDECWHAEERDACEGDENDHAPQFPDRFSDTEPDGLRSPRAISLYRARGSWLGGRVVDLFGTGCFNGRISIDRRTAGGWKRVRTAELWSGEDDSFVVGFLDTRTLTEPGRYRARLGSVPERDELGGTGNCMAAVSEPLTWRPSKGR